MKQSGIAELLNVTQAAVSYYTRELRGAAVNIEKVEEIRQAVEEIAAALASGDWSAPDLTKSFCVACSAARERGLICRLHKKMEPSISLRDCKVCKPDRTSSAKRTR